MITLGRTTHRSRFTLACAALLLALPCPALAQAVAENPATPKTAAIFPFSFKNGLAPSVGAAFEGDVRKLLTTALEHAGYQVLTPAEAEQALSKNGKSMPMEDCANPMGSGFCVMIMGIGAYASGTVFPADGRFFAYLRAGEVDPPHEILNLELEASSLKKLRQDFQKKAPQLLAAQSVHGPPKTVVIPKTSHQGHALREPLLQSKQLSDCDEVLLNAYAERGFNRQFATTGGDAKTIMSRGQAAAAAKLERCAAAFGPIYHYTLPQQPGEPFSRHAWTAPPVLSVEQCGDLRDRIAELHDAAREEAYSGMAVGAETLMKQAMVIPTFTGLMTSCL